MTTLDNGVNRIEGVLTRGSRGAGESRLSEVLANLSPEAVDREVKELEVEIAERKETIKLLRSVQTVFRRRKNAPTRGGPNGESPPSPKRRIDYTVFTYLEASGPSNDAAISAGTGVELEQVQAFLERRTDKVVKKRDGTWALKK